MQNSFDLCDFLTSENRRSLEKFDTTPSGRVWHGLSFNFQNIINISLTFQSMRLLVHAYVISTFLNHFFKYSFLCGLFSFYFHCLGDLKVRAAAVENL